MEHHSHPHNSLFLIMYAVMMAYGVGMMIYSIPQQAKARGSYLAWKDRNVMLFQKPLPLRRSILAASGFCVLMLLSLLAMAHGARNPFPMYLQSIVAVSLPVFFLYLSGPNDIRLDGGQRTYERTRGWPWKPVTQFGTFESVKGIAVSPQNSVLLLLEKSGTLSKGVILSSTGTKTAAEALVEELRQAYGFPIVPYPKS
ncbi:MAG: hypothetical protein ACRYFS_04605 [Janthinobacterium lividum]